MKDTTEGGFISVNEAAKRSGLRRQAVIARLSPEHPDAIPVMVYPNLGGKPSYRIPEEAFSEWLRSHRV